MGTGGRWGSPGGDRQQLSKETSGSARPSPPAQRPQPGSGRVAEPWPRRSPGRCRRPHVAPPHGPPALPALPARAGPGGGRVFRLPAEATSLAGRARSQPVSASRPPSPSGQTPLPPPPPGEEGAEPNRAARG